jgi:hypothetical protein
MCKGPRKLGLEGRCPRCLFIGRLQKHDVYVCGTKVILSYAVEGGSWKPYFEERQEAELLAAPYLADNGKLYKAMLKITQ